MPGVELAVHVLKEIGVIPVARGKAHDVEIQLARGKIETAITVGVEFGAEDLVNAEIAIQTLGAGAVQESVGRDAAYFLADRGLVQVYVAGFCIAAPGRNGEFAQRHAVMVEGKDGGKRVQDGELGSDGLRFAPVGLGVCAILKDRERDTKK